MTMILARIAAVNPEHELESGRFRDGIATA